MNAYGERYAFGMSRPKLNINGLQVPSYFVDRASEAWHVVRNMVADVDIRDGQMRYKDFVSMCRNINCFLPDKDLDELWSAISSGGRNGVCSTKTFAKILGGFLPGNSTTDMYKTEMKLASGSSGLSTRMSNRSNRSESSFLASLPVPHFYGVDKSDPTCMHQLTGVRFVVTHIFESTLSMLHSLIIQKFLILSNSCKQKRCGVLSKPRELWKYVDLRRSSRHSNFLLNAMALAN
jgi:hypothetical protein